VDNRDQRTIEIKYHLPLKKKVISSGGGSTTSGGRAFVFILEGTAIFGLEERRPSRGLPYLLSTEVLPAGEADYRSRV